MDVTGSVTAAIMLSQAMYWSDKTEKDDGWFYKTMAEWQSETKLTRHEQEGARKKLIATGFWHEELRDVPAKLYFMVDEAALGKAIKALPPANKFAGKRQPGNPKSANLVSGESATYIGTEITTETTQRNKSANALAGYSRAFDLFWQAYPTGSRGKSGKGAAWKSWARQKLDRQLSEIIAAIAKWKKCDQWTKDQGAYIPNPATWLNQKRWEDELPRAEASDQPIPPPGEMSERDAAFYKRYDPNARTQ